MSLCRSRAFLITWAATLFLGLAGCRNTPRRLAPPDLKDDFGSSLETQPITAESVSEKQMLHRRWQLEVKPRVSIPTGFFEDNGFEIGPGIGVKAQIETEKNLFVGFEFDYGTWRQGDGIKDPLGSPTSLAGVKPDQFYDDVERFDFLLAVDYDWTLAKNFITRGDPLKLRFGGGLGATLVEGDVDPFLDEQFKAAGSDIEIVPFVGLLARLAVGLRWQVHDNVIVFIESSYDLVAPFTMEVRINRDRSEVDGNIDFGSINFATGVAFEF